MLNIKKKPLKSPKRVPASVSPQQAESDSAFARDACAKMIDKALWPEGAPSQEEADGMVVRGLSIEIVLHGLHGGTTGKEYKAQARSLALNLKRNAQLCSELRKGQLKVEELVRMKEAELATLESRHEREKTEEKLLRMATLSDHEGLSSLTHEYTCKECGGTECSFLDANNAFFSSDYVMSDLGGVMDEMVGPLQEVFKDLQDKWREMNAQEPVWSVIGGFIHAIDWQERWLIGVLASELLLILAAVFTRKHSSVQAVIFFVAAGIVYMAERLNAIGGQHWTQFATQNYFDQQGVFFSAVVSGPLLIVAFIVLINYLIECSSLLVKAKRQELKFKAKERSKKEGTGQASSVKEKKNS
eukprot:gene9781-7664_t